MRKKNIRTSFAVNFEPISLREYCLYNEKQLAIKKNNKIEMPRLPNSVIQNCNSPDESSLSDLIIRKHKVKSKNKQTDMTGIGPETCFTVSRNLINNGN